MSLAKRRRAHIAAAFNNSPLPFHRALKIFGTKNFKWEVIDKAYSQAELDRKEQEYIGKHASFIDPDLGYNRHPGGKID